MKKVSYTLVAPIGSGTARKKGTLPDLVMAVPYLLSGYSNGGFIPPLIVLNDVLKTDGSEGGMSGGCKWSPFEIDEEEYKSLVKALRRVSGKDYRLLFAPSWVRTYSDWVIWQTELFLGVPSRKHRNLAMKCKRIEQSITEASASGDDKLLAKLRWRHLKAEIELAKFTNKYNLVDQGYYR